MLVGVEERRESQMSCDRFILLDEVDCCQASIDPKIVCNFRHRNLVPAAGC